MTEEKHNILLDNFTIPIEVALNKKLDRTCLLLFSLIKKLDHARWHCFASNSYLASSLNTHSNTISVSISTLIEQGYIEQVSFDGRRRVIKIKEDFKVAHKQLKVESDDRLSDFKDQQRQPIADQVPLKNEGKNEQAYSGSSRQPIADQVGSLKRNVDILKDQLLKDQLLKDQLDLKASLNRRNSVPPYFKEIFVNNKPEELKTESNPVKSSILHPINRNVELKTESNPVKSSILHPRKKININRNVELKIEDEPEPVKPYFVKKKKTPVVKKSNEVLEIMDYWRHKGFVAHQERTLSELRAVNQIYALLDGSLFSSFRNENDIRKYKVFEAKRAIDNFALAAFNRNYMPQNETAKKHLQKMPFCNFFYNAMKGRDEDKSVFLKYLYGKPKLVSESVFHLATDTTPKVTKILLNWYQRNFGNKINGPVPTSDRNKIIFCGKSLKQFYEENKTKLQISSEWKRIYGEYDEVNFLAVQLTRALDKELRENDSLFSVFHLGWLTSEKTLQERLPNFLRAESIMK